jgi:hypothetical protein
MPQLSRKGKNLCTLLSRRYFQAWLDEHFKKTERDQLMLFTAENVLTPAALRQVLQNNGFLDQLITM